jgi:hypothetical protein
MKDRQILHGWLLVRPCCEPKTSQSYMLSGFLQLKGKSKTNEGILYDITVSLIVRFMMTAFSKLCMLLL